MEGYTNFLWVLLSAVPIALGHGPVGWSRAVGFAAHLATIAGVLATALRLTTRPLVAFAGTLLYALSPAAAVWATAGLETPLFAALVVWAVWFSLHDAAPTRAAVLCAAATLARPEGLLVTAALAAGAAWPARRRLAFLSIVAAALAPWLAWRIAYYGDLLPNSFHAKVGMSGAQVGRGVQYLIAFLVECGSWAVASVALGVAAARRSGARRPAARLLLLIVLPYGAYIVAVGGDFMPMDRFFVPLLGPSALLVVCGLDGLLERRAAVLWAAGATMAWAIVCARPAFAGASFEYVRQDQREVETWTRIGLWFRDHAAPGDSIALVPAGAVPFYSRLAAIDLLGLNDRTIARSRVAHPGAAPAGHERSDAAYALARRPTYVLLGTYGLTRDPPDASSLLPLYYEAEKEVAASPEFRSTYRLRSGRCPGGYFAFFERRDAAAPPPPPAAAPDLSPDTVRPD